MSNPGEILFFLRRTRWHRSHKQCHALPSTERRADLDILRVLVPLQGSSRIGPRAWTPDLLRWDDGVLNVECMILHCVGFAL
jgi:hypothetical protein